MDNNIGLVDIHKAMIQWLDLRHIIMTLDEVCEIEAVDGLPDMVFTANAGLVFPDNSVIVSQFSKSERQPETPFFHNWFEKNSFNIIDFPNVSFEGAGDALFDCNNKLWIGYGFRTDKKAIDIITELYSNTESLELINPNFYHLDTAFCPLNDGHCLYYPEAFSLESRMKIVNYFGTNAIPVSYDDAFNFSCNAVNINDVIIFNTISIVLKRYLMEIGFKIIETCTSEFMKSGGSCKCLTLKL